MSDITKCSTKKIRERCKSCYRRLAEDSEWQAYADFSKECFTKGYPYYGYPYPRERSKDEKE